MTNRPLPSFEVKLESRAIAVRQALKDIANNLQPQHLEQEESNAVELVMAEVLNNIVEHAYPAPDLSGDITVRCLH